MCGALPIRPLMKILKYGGEFRAVLDTDFRVSAKIDSAQDD